MIPSTHPATEQPKEPLWRELVSRFRRAFIMETFDLRGTGAGTPDDLRELHGHQVRVEGKLSFVGMNRFAEPLPIGELTVWKNRRVYRLDVDLGDGGRSTLTAWTDFKMPENEALSVQGIVVARTGETPFLKDLIIISPKR